MPRTRQRTPPDERFWPRVDAFGDCWEWTGRRNKDGYGRFDVTAHGAVYTHTYAWEALVGPVPEGLELDHLCRNPACCNPDHLEPVTRKVNTLRGYGPSARHARKTHCPAGHPYDQSNTHLDTRGQRNCRACGRVRARQYRADKRDDTRREENRVRMQAKRNAAVLSHNGI